MSPRRSNPGDVVCVGPGLYVEGDISLGRDGAPGVPEIMDYPIEIRADAERSRRPTTRRARCGSCRPPACRRSRRPAPRFCVLGRHDLVIDGFEISGFRDAGIQVRSGVTMSADNSANVTIRNNDVRNCRTGIDVNAEGMVVIEGNTVVGNRESGISVRGAAP